MATARKLASGNYRCLLYVGKDADGKRQYKSFTAPTKREAERLALEYESSQDTAEAALTLNEAASNYIAAKSNVLSPSTIAGYKKILRVNFQDIAHLPVGLITQAQIQKAVNAWSVNLAPKTVRNVYGFLVAVIKFARPDFNAPATLPQKEKKEFYIPSETDIKTIYKAIKGTSMELPFLLASQLGLRASEIRAVVSDPKGHIENGMVHIKDAIVRGEEKYVKKQTKTVSGDRTIPCSDYILKMLIENKNEYVDISPAWHSCMKKIDVHYFNFHTLRHYFASQALLQGIPQMYIAEMMGHSSTHMIEQVYQHTFPDAKIEFQKRMIALTDRIILSK